MYLGFEGDVSRWIPINAINSKEAILAYWLKCTCRCQTQVTPGAVVVRPPGIDLLALAPGTLEGTFFPPQRVDGGLTVFGIEELVDV
jgi:hypothetical protein